MALSYRFVLASKAFSVLHSARKRQIEHRLALPSYKWNLSRASQHWAWQRSTFCQVAVSVKKEGHLKRSNPV